MKTVVFLCVANSARSQMAEGLARASAPEGWKVFSAGSRPTQVNPHAAVALRELDIDPDRQHAKGLDDVPIRDADWVITLCAEEECPVAYTKGTRLHWPFPDPAAADRDEALRRFREIRDAIRERLAMFWKEQA